MRESRVGGLVNFPASGPMVDVNRLSAPNLIWRILLPNGSVTRCPIRSHGMHWESEADVMTDTDMGTGAAGRGMHLTAGEWDRTGVRDLDTLLGGGLPRGSLVLIMGLPGSGKTTLASQIAFTAARSGRRVLILTALSESTNKLIAHLGAFTFFDPALIGGPVQFLSLQGSLSDGLEATATTILAEARRMRADLVMLDGFRGMRSVGDAPQAAREFLYNLGTTLGTLSCTTLITSETDPRDPTFFPETTTADVILGLHYQLLGVRQYRGIEVVKSRATAPLPGLHALTLTADGASVYSQLEERVSLDARSDDAQTQGAALAMDAKPATASTRGRVTFDLPVLDAMLSGGIPRATCTLLAGSLGTGKTLIALHFALAGVRAGERVVFLGFRESREQLRQAAAPFGMGPELDRALSPGGGLTFLEVPPIKVNADILGHRLLAELDQTGAQRLVVDSIAELERAILRSPDPNRLEDYLAALLRAVRARSVTALLLKETDKALAATLDFSADPLSLLAENVLLLQQLPFRGQLYRILSILKLRFSAHDATLREFRIAAPEGVTVLQPFASATGVLAGITRDQEEEASGQRREAGRRNRANRGSRGDG
jgi:circadian clock protein KaiC